MIQKLFVETIASNESTKLVPQFFKENLNDSKELVPNFIEKNSDVTEDKDIKKIPCRNGDLAGSTHPETGVPFEKKVIEVDGEQIEVVVPQFDSVFDAQLPDDLCDASDKKQESECNKQLKDAIDNNPDQKSMFTDEQLEQIMNGDTPDGYTWHHDAEKGKMQLVDSETHAKTGHTGGKNFWGGGTDNR